MKNEPQHPTGKPIIKPAAKPVEPKPPENEAYAEIAEKGASRVRELMEAVKDGTRREDPAHEK